MLAKQYIAKNEFELFGTLVKELSEVDFPMNAVKALCFKREAQDSWLIFETLETSVAEICGGFVCKHRSKNFVVTLDATKSVYEVCFQGLELFLFIQLEGQRLSVIEFEDKTPSEAFKDFEKKELKDSIGFLKKILKDG